MQLPASARSGGPLLHGIRPLASRPEQDVIAGAPGVNGFKDLRRRSTEGTDRSGQAARVGVDGELEPLHQQSGLQIHPRWVHTARLVVDICDGTRIIQGIRED